MGQINTMAPLITGGGFTRDSGFQHRLPGAAVGLQVNRIPDGIAHHVAVIFLFHQGRPFQTKTNGRKLGISKGMGPGCLAGNFQSHTDFIFSTGNTLNISLSLRAGAKFPGHATEVLRTISIFKRGAIKINIFPG